MTFFMGLNEQFVNVHCQIFMMDPLPVIDKVFALVSHDEKHCQISSLYASTNSLVACVVTATPSKPNRCEHPSCSRCGILGHLKKKCYKLHGYPSSFNIKPFNKKSNASINNVVDPEPATGTIAVSNQQYRMMIQFIQAQMAKHSSI